jgi:hypothetical protein
VIFFGCGGGAEFVVFFSANPSRNWRNVTYVPILSYGLHSSAVVVLNLSFFSLQTRHVTGVT